LRDRDCGLYGGLNVGDEAIPAISELRSAIPDSEIVVFSRNVADTRERHNVDRVVPAREAMRAQIPPVAGRLDLLLLGGLLFPEPALAVHQLRLCPRARRSLVSDLDLEFTNAKPTCTAVVADARDVTPAVCASDDRACALDRHPRKLLQHRAA